MSLDSSAEFYCLGIKNCNKKAANFKQIEGVWIPFTLSTISFQADGKTVSHQTVVEIQNVTILTGKDKPELNVSDVIPPDRK